MKNAVHFGAGNIGRGFIGDLLNESGYKITFLDVDTDMVDRLHREGSYDLRRIDQDYKIKTIAPVDAVSTITQQDECLDAIDQADLITTSVWANNLPKIAPLLAKGLKRRSENGEKKINVIACENAMFASDILRDEILNTGILTEEELDQAASFPNTAVDRVVLGTTVDGRPVVDIADYHELAVEEPKLVDGIRPIDSAHYTDNLQKFLERKLYVINCGHATAGYLGYQKGMDSVYDVFVDPELVAEVREAMEEAAALILDKYDFTEEEMKEYTDFGVRRYQTKGVDYPVSMVTRSPIRKLGSTDRLVGPCTQCEERGMKNDALIRSIARVLLLDNDDEQAVELQEYIRKNGAEKALEHYSGIAPGSVLSGKILSAYDSFLQERV